MPHPSLCCTHVNSLLCCFQSLAKNTCPKHSYFHYAFPQQRRLARTSVLCSGGVLVDVGLSAGSLPVALVMLVGCLVCVSVGALRNVMAQNSPKKLLHTSKLQNVLNCPDHAPLARTYRVHRAQK
ncbi:unnamed protein product [Polarella glacialis]|uniref:Uncharacterized protein n=1 Tax=Polarella glacialis TaxID=89957 RepID=A0A813D8R2_POLGL|nr:unnamed protein product [Polarella glacialis]